MALRFWAQRRFGCVFLHGSIFLRRGSRLRVCATAAPRGSDHDPYMLRNVRSVIFPFGSDFVQTFFVVSFFGPVRRATLALRRQDCHGGQVSTVTRVFQVRFGSGWNLGGSAEPAENTG